MVNLSHSSSKNACSHKESAQTAVKVVPGVVLVLPWHSWQLKCSWLSLWVRVVFCQAGVYSSSFMLSLVQNTHLVQSLNHCNSCFSGVDETCGFGKILAVSVCELSFVFVCWVTFQEGWVGKFRESADKSYKSLLCSVFDSVSGSDVLEAVRQESSTEDESLSIGPVLVFLDKQG